MLTYYTLLIFFCFVMMLVRFRTPAHSPWLFTGAWALLALWLVICPEAWLIPFFLYYLVLGVGTLFHSIHTYLLCRDGVL